MRHVPASLPSAGRGLLWDWSLLVIPSRFVLLSCVLDLHLARTGAVEVRKDGYGRPRVLWGSKTRKFAMLSGGGGTVSKRVGLITKQKSTSVTRMDVTWKASSPTAHWNMPIVGSRCRKQFSDMQLRHITMWKFEYVGRQSNNIFNDYAAFVHA